MTKIRISNLDRQNEPVRTDVMVWGVGVTVPGATRDGGGRLKVGPTGSVVVDLEVGTTMMVESAEQQKPSVSRETFLDQLTDRVHEAYEGVKADGEELSDDAYVLYHEVLHSLGISRATPKPVAPDAPPESPAPSEPSAPESPAPESPPNKPAP